MDVQKRTEQHQTNHNDIHVEAIPVDAAPVVNAYGMGATPNQNQANNSTGVYAYHGGTIAAEPHQPIIQVEAVAHAGPNYGYCRRCGRQFVRTPDINEASAQYYRCRECAQLHVTDFCVIS
jgi:hypothetical protein